ncbi:MAG: KamA family radical SAM protein [Verrucomicrobiae bacterium]|nr:KamA family radical SAM protein [Verrucomicrobiae bacterium]
MKAFRPTDRSDWPQATEAEWADWTWQLRNRVTTLADLETRIELTREERAGVALSGSKLAMAITPQFWGAIDKDDPNCPVRRQVIPNIAETLAQPYELDDPCGEDSHSPVPGLVHRYPDRVLFLVTDRCASYCRYCTRSRLVSNASGYDFHPEYERALKYIEQHSEVRDVLLSGGDPLLLSDAKLDHLLGRLRAIPHVEFIRIGSRIPIFLPQRITEGLLNVLRKHAPIWMSVHTNHPRELTTEVKAGLDRLADAGVPLGNQSVFLRGVNDDPVVMKALVQKLLMCRVKPYYLYLCDLIQGTSHLRASVQSALRVIEALRGHTTGYAIPQLVIDAPGGGGKVPINPDYVIFQDDDKILFRNYEGKVFEYPEPSAAPMVPVMKLMELVTLDRRSNYA